jgi:hypothetical protein
MPWLVIRGNEDEHGEALDTGKGLTSETRVLEVSRPGTSATTT